MSNVNGNREYDGKPVDDGALAAHYRSVADESTPRHLDDAVLGRARKAVGASSLFAWSGWYRPAAFAASLTLGVLVLLQLADTGILQPIGSPTPNEESATPSAATGSSFSEAAEREAERIRSLPGARDTTRSAPAGDAGMLPMQTLPAAVQGSDDGCSEAERSSPGRWWQCIRALQDQGLPIIAERELNELLQSYPRFTLPATP